MVRVLIYFAFISAIYSQTELIETKFSINSPDAEKVYLSGSFNNWNPNSTPLKKKDKFWEITLKLKPGYYYYFFLTDSLKISDPQNDWKVPDGNGGNYSIVKVGEPPEPVRKNSKKPLPRHKLPFPILEDNPEWVDLYYASWAMLWNQLRAEKSMGKFYPGSDLMNTFTIYAPDIFPTAKNLNNYYETQRDDGYIIGNYSSPDEKLLNVKKAEIPLINPVFFPWLELRYFDVTGDLSRLKRVHPKLIDNFVWMSENISEPTGLGVFYDTKLKRLMHYGIKDSTAKPISLDLLCQQALAAMSIANISTAIGDDLTARDFYIMHYFISKNINKTCWDYETNFYYDLNSDSSFASYKSIDGFWTLLSQVSDSLTTAKLLEHLVNPDEFWRPHLVPNISADSENYNPLGYYQAGAVSAQSNFMLVKGLEKYGHYALAREIAENHMNNVSAVYNDFIPDESNIAYEDRFSDGYKTIWESYSPEFNLPATRSDMPFYARQDFAGGAGLASVAMLIENILGFELSGPWNKIKWRINREDRHGIKSLNFKGDKIDLICTPSPSEYRFTVKCNSSFILEIESDEGEFVKKIDYGNTAFSIQRESNLQTGIK